MLTPDDVGRPSEGLSGRSWWLGCALVMLGALAATVPTAGDIGLTWDEPSYRTSQLISAQWWEAIPKVRTRADLDALFSPDALLYYWPYARFGYNFHPPLAGQLNLLTHAILGGWMKDIPSRRMASVIEYSLTITLAFGFLARRYGAWVGGVAAGALLVMPRVYGDGHIAGTDTPGAPALGRHRPGLLERLERAPREEVAGGCGDRAGPGFRREDGGRRGARAAVALAGRDAVAKGVSAGRLGRRRDHLDGDALADRVRPFAR